MKERQTNQIDPRLKKYRMCRDMKYYGAIAVSVAGLGYGGYDILTSKSYEEVVKGIPMRNNPSIRIVTQNEITNNVINKLADGTILIFSFLGGAVAISRLRELKQEDKKFDDICRNK